MDRGKLVPPLTFRSQKGKKNPRAKYQRDVIFSQILTNTIRVDIFHFHVFVNTDEIDFPDSFERILKLCKLN